ncbi:MAG: hypothetical protein ACFFBP_22815 [Promethearchaeota archaeon]
MTLEHSIEIIESKIKIGIETEEIEKYYYNLLSESLKKKKFENFRKLLDYSVKLNIFIDVKKIPNRFEIISNLIVNCIYDALEGPDYQNFLGTQIEILKFCNKFNLFEKDRYLKKDIKLFEELKKDKIIIANLKDIFGTISNSLLYFVFHIMPRGLYGFFKFLEKSYAGFTMKYVLNYFNQYASYRLFVQKIGKVSDFLEKFDKIYEEYKQNTIISSDKISFIKFNYLGKSLLVSTENILKNREKILELENYHFYSLAMVELGGLGPQGHGFIYSTPRGELIEICSDARETEAIIVKYKKFKKQQFLKKLETHLSHLTINHTIQKKIIKYLSEVLKIEELIDYYKKKPILDQIIKYLNEDQNFPQKNESEFQNLINNISNELTLILRTIRMEDQFKTRMKLVHEDKLKSEEVAKYTCLNEKSHYDVLRERVFYQNLLTKFYKIFER